MIKLITVGRKVKLKEEYFWLAEKYNLTLGKEYEVIKTNKFWCSATIVNDVGKNTTFDVDRFDLVPEKLDFDNLVIGGTFSGKTQIPFIQEFNENNKKND